ncbi:hypothetical protein ON010_g8546 [Phytophthora cinnamomi]|nr:hypothetical protein ON010_g8546 [Phytophthora cinnamomi]
MKQRRCTLNPLEFDGERDVFLHAAGKHPEAPSYLPVPYPATKLVARRPAARSGGSSRFRITIGQAGFPWPPSRVTTQHSQDTKLSPATLQSVAVMTTAEAVWVRNSSVNMAWMYTYCVTLFFSCSMTMLAAYHMRKLGGDLFRSTVRFVIAMFLLCSTLHALAGGVFYAYLIHAVDAVINQMKSQSGSGSDITQADVSVSQLLHNDSKDDGGEAAYITKLTQDDVPLSTVLTALLLAENLFFILSAYWIFLLSRELFKLAMRTLDRGDAAAERGPALPADLRAERQARNDALRGVDKHAPLTAAAKALYASGIKCAEATARQDFGDEQGEETISAFDAIDASAKKKKPSGGSSFFKSSSKSSKSSTASRNGGSMAATASKPAEAKKLDMSNVLTVDSDDEEDDETDAPVFVKKTTSSKRVISDDDDEEEDEAPKPKAASKSRNVKRKLNASPAVAKKAKQVEEVELEEEEEEEEAEEEEPVVATKRRVLVSKTRINEQGYMVTEKTYEEVELTQEEVDKEQKAAKKQLEDKKKKAAAEKAAKAKKEAKKHSGPPKQRDLRSFFSVK